MKRLLITIALTLGLLNIFPTASATTGGDPCTAVSDGRPVFDHLRWWEAHGWSYIGGGTFVGYRLVCHVDRPNASDYPFLIGYKFGRF